MKQILTRGVIIGLIIVLIACVGGMGDQILRFLVPPRIYIIIGLLVLAALVTIIHNQNRGKNE